MDEVHMLTQTNFTAKNILIQNRRQHRKNREWNGLWIFKMWHQYQDKHNQLMCILTLNQELATKKQKELCLHMVLKSKSES